VQASTDPTSHQNNLRVVGPRLKGSLVLFCFGKRRKDEKKEKNFLKKKVKIGTGGY